MKSTGIAGALTANPLTQAQRHVLRRRTAEVASLLTEWKRRRAYRDDLRRLLCVGRYMIIDIGLTPEEALYESRKTFWKP